MTSELTSIVDSGEVEEHGLVECLRKLWRTLTHNLPLRIIAFLLYGALACVAPYLSLYFRQLGIDAFRIGILFTIRPIVGVICTPLWGYLADRFRAWRPIFILSIIGTMIFGTVLAYVPAADKSPCDEAISSLATSVGMSSDQFGNQSQITDDTFITELNRQVHKQRIQDSATWLYDSDGLMQLFLVMIGFIILYELFFAANLTFLDVSILCELEDDHESYSNIRSIGSLGWIIGALSSGLVLQIGRSEIIECGIDMVYTNYRLSFIMMALLYLFSLPFVCTLKYDHKTGNSEYQIKEFMRLLCCPGHVSVYLMAIFIGTCNGFVWYFLSYHLQNLGASQSLIALALTVGAGSEIVWGFFIHKPVLQRFGHINVLYAGLVVYCIRFLAYGLIQNPLWILPIEIAQGFSFFAVWNTLISYTIKSFPPQFLATSIAFLGAIFNNLGIGIGTFMSGFLIGEFNSTTTCYIYSITSTCVLVLFILARLTVNNQPELESMNLITIGLQENKEGKGKETSRLSNTPPPQPMPADQDLTTVTQSYNSTDVISNDRS